MIDYDPHDWRSHLLDVRGSLLPEILLRITICVAWAFLVTAVNRYLVDWGMSSTPHALVGAALSLLLVFRTNVAYDRFWEGRRAWGVIVNQSRDLGRLAATSLSSATELRDAVLRWTISFSHATLHRLRGTKDHGEQTLGAFIPASELPPLLASPNVPLAVATQIGQQLQTAQQRGLIGEMIRVALDDHVRMLVDQLGTCERIRNTPLPFAYVVHLRRALLLYAYTLPFALVHDYGWWTIPTTAILAFIFFGIEEIGVEIENPFEERENDLPLERFCEMITRELTAFTKDSRR